MKIFRLITVWILGFSFVSVAMAQVTQPVATPSVVFSSYLAGYACRYTIAGTCQVAITPATPIVNQFKESSLLAFSDSFGSVYGQSSVNGLFDPMHYFPTMGAYASSTNIAPQLPNPDPAKYTGKTGSISDANISAVAKYRYNGKYAGYLNLSGYLESIISLPGDNPLLGHSMMKIGIFEDGNYDYSIDGLCPIGGFSNCPTDATTLGTLSYTLNSTGRQILDMLFYVVPGQEFYIGMTLDANVCCGGTVDSSHTLSMGFSDSSNLELLAVPGAPVTVDEPQTILLVIVALIGWRMLVSREQGLPLRSMWPMRRLPDTFAAMPMSASASIHG